MISSLRSSKVYKVAAVVVTGLAALSCVEQEKKDIPTKLGEAYYEGVVLEDELLETSIDHIYRVIIPIEEGGEPVPFNVLGDLEKLTQLDDQINPGDRIKIDRYITAILENGEYAIRASMIEKAQK